MGLYFTNRHQVGPLDATSAKHVAHWTTIKRRFRRAHSSLYAGGRACAAACALWPRFDSNRRPGAIGGQPCSARPLATRLRPPERPKGRQVTAETCHYWPCLSRVGIPLIEAIKSKINNMRRLIWLHLVAGAPVYHTKRRFVAAASRRLCGRLVSNCSSPGRPSGHFDVARRPCRRRRRLLQWRLFASTASNQLAAPTANRGAARAAREAIFQLATLQNAE